MHSTEARLAMRAAAHRSWSATPDRAARTAPGRTAAYNRFERQVDPEGVLDPDERAQRAEAARKAFYAEFARIGLEARKAKAAGRK